MKRAALVLLLCAVAVCGNVFAGGKKEVDRLTQEKDEEITRLTREKDEEISRLTKEVASLEVRLSDQFIETARTPLTPQIVKQIRDDNKENLFTEMQYYTSVNITLIRDITPGSSVDLRNEPTSRSPATGGPADVNILRFTEGDSSLDQRRILRMTQGRLASFTSEYDVFEIAYPGNQITLGFTLNAERNWYDLQYVIDGNSGTRIPLIMTGAHPHLMTNYRADFSTTETRIQLQPPPLPSSPQSLAPEPDTGVLPWEETPYKETALGSVENRDDYYYPEDDYYDYGDEYYNYDLPVEVEVWALAPAEPRPPQGATAAGGNFFVVQIGAFEDKKLADAAYEALTREGFNPDYDNHKDDRGVDLTRVFIPAVESKDLARTRERVKALGFGEPYLRP